MSTEYLVVGHFGFVDDTKSAIQALREKGLENFELYSPFPNHDLEDEVYKGKRRSPVRMFTLIGGLTGCLGAFLMTTWMSMDYPLRTSAKTIVSIPAFVVIAFECTILLGALFTLVGMLHNSKLPWPFATPGFKADFSKDTFGVVVRVDKSEAENLKEEFVKLGAKDVQVEYVR